jgi:hypothetical protein
MFLKNLSLFDVEDSYSQFSIKKKVKKKNVACKMDEWTTKDSALHCQGGKFPQCHP